MALVFSFALMVSCTVRHADVAGEQNTLQDTDWVLLSFEEQEVPAAPNTRTSYIHFDSKNNKVKGYAGCNNFFGTYTLKGDHLTLQQLGSTRMACPDMEVENYLMAVLERVNTYTIAGDLLTLYSKGTAVAIFRAGYEQPAQDNEPLPEQQP